MKKLNWHEIPWDHCNREVANLQEELVMALRNGSHKQVKEVQRKLVVGLSARCLAVRKVVTNSGSKTSGIDGILWESSTARTNAIENLREITMNPRNYKAMAVKRVWIPKPGKEEKRPLGIPTMLDRAIQALYLQALDPIVEEGSDPSSFGFRRYRSAQDAISRIRNLLDKTSSPEFVLEADIEKCFDQISHNYLLENTLICDKTMLEQWLKAGILEDGNFFESEVGSPQGGIISPLLCNVALNGLEKCIQKTAMKHYPSKLRDGRPKMHCVRYADDFIVTGRNREELDGAVREGISSFLETRGLRLKGEKTCVVSTHEGFNFLGFSIKRHAWSYKHNGPRKQKTVLIIKPGKAQIQKLKDRIKELTQSQKPMEAIIRDLNPVIRGWAEYYRTSYHSQIDFWKLGHFMYEKMWRWARKRHPRRRADWIYAKYVWQSGTRKWNFGLEPSKCLYDISTVSTYRLSPLKLTLNPYVKENVDYFLKRREVRINAKFRAEIYKRWLQKCPHCKQSLHNGETVELHHVIPQREGGKWTLENIQPLHRICHQSVTFKK